MAHFMLDAAEKGSDLGETMSKVKEVFGASAGTINAMAKDMADRFGSVKKVTLDAASNFGLVAQGAGLTSSKAAELSTRLTRLADDASSFYNVPLEIALEKIRSGLVGESEPLRAFGVLLSEDAVKQQALAMGLKTTTGELTEQEKVMARVELITKGLTKATGDHERTLGSYANQVRRLKGELENWKTDVGGPISGFGADFLTNLRQKGFGAAIAGAWGFDWQKAADDAVGVQKGLPAPPQQPPRGFQEAALWAKRIQDMAAIEDAQIMADFKARQFNPMPGGLGPGLFGFGMLGGFGQQLNQKAMMADLDRQIKELEKPRWGGSHVMDATSWQRQAQETILAKTDDAQIKALKDMKLLLENIRDNTKIKGGGPVHPPMVLKGRES